MERSLISQHNSIFLRHGLVLLILCLLAYWPLSLGIFSVKNDAIHYFLPFRYQVTEALRNGEWPFWSPYLYLGYPIYGDMQSGAWNPITWLFSFFGRYDLHSFHAETLLYIFLGGIGMYKVCGRICRHSSTPLVVAASYMLGGFMLSGQLINWLASAAFIPFVIYYYLQLRDSSKYGPAIKTAVALYLLFTAGYPSFFIISGYILLLIFILSIIDKKRKLIDKSWWQIFLQHALLVILFAALAFPAIISFIELLPYYQRGSGASYAEVIRNPFEWQHLISLFFPSAIKANDIITQTDITCRNVYTGLLVIPLLIAIPPTWHRRNILLATLGFLALLFSLGDSTPVRKLCYQFLPLMDSFRHPSQARLFFMISLLLLAAPSLEKLLNSDLGNSAKKIIRLTLVILFLLFTLITIACLPGSGLINQLVTVRNTGITVAVKNLIENLSLRDVIAINGIIQILFIAAFYWWFKRNLNWKVFTGIWILNLFVFAQLVLPLTFISRTSPKEINGFIHNYPQGFPTQGLQNTIADNSMDATSYFDKIALTYFYNKKIGISKITNNPAFLEQQEKFITNDFLYSYVSSQPVTYIADKLLNNGDSSQMDRSVCRYAFFDKVHTDSSSCNQANTAIIKKISANQFLIEANSSDMAMLVLSQNYHHNWVAKVDGKKQEIVRVNGCFMGINLNPGIHQVVFKFVPSNTILAMWIQFFTFFVMLILAIKLLIGKNRVLN